MGGGWKALVNPVQLMLHESHNCNKKKNNNKKKKSLAIFSLDFLNRIPSSTHKRINTFINFFFFLNHRIFLFSQFRVTINLDGGG